MNIHWELGNVYQKLSEEVTKLLAESISTGQVLRTIDDIDILKKSAVKYLYDRIDSSSVSVQLAVLEELANIADSSDKYRIMMNHVLLSDVSVNDMITSLSADVFRKLSSQMILPVTGDDAV